jgi:DNA-binding CsgD family transcriptional regulator
MQIYEYLFGRIDLSYIEFWHKNHLDGRLNYKHISPRDTNELLTRRARPKYSQRLTAAEKDLIEQAYSDGLCNREISRKLGISRYKIDRYFRRNSKVPNKRIQINPCRAVKIIELNGEEVELLFDSAVKCAEFLGCTPNGVRNVANGSAKTTKGAKIIYV